MDKHLKLRSKTLKMRCFSCRFELFSYLCNRFTTHLVLFGYYNIGNSFVNSVP